MAKLPRALLVELAPEPVACLALLVPVPVLAPVPMVVGTLPEDFTPSVVALVALVAFRRFCARTGCVRVAGGAATTDDAGA